MGEGEGAVEYSQARTVGRGEEETVFFTMASECELGK